MRLPGLPVEGPPSHVPTCLHSFNSCPTRPRRAPFPPASMDPILRQPGLRHDPASVDPQHLSLGRNTGPAWPGVIPTPSQFDPLRFHHLLLHGRPHGRYCGRRSQVHHKDAEAATHSTGQSALRSPHLLGPLRSIHQHRLLPGPYPGTAGPLHLLSGGTPARPAWACSPLPARILHGRRRHSNRTTTMADPTKRPAVCPSWPPSPGGMLNRPRGTSLARLSGWIRSTSGLPVNSSRARANRCCVHTTAEGDSDGSHSDAVPLGIARPGGCGVPHHRWSVLCVPRGPLGLPCGHHCGRLLRVHYVDAERPHTEGGSPLLRSCPDHLYVSHTTTVDSLSCSKLG